jgi:hypothetical protein
MMTLKIVTSDSDTTMAKKTPLGPFITLVANQ